MTSAHKETESATPGKNIDRLMAALIEALPIFDQKAFDAVVAEVKAHPRAALHYLFDHFVGEAPPLQAMISRILIECAGHDIIDNLNAIIFDAEHDEQVKVRANDILAALGEPIDPDVFAMSVSDPAPYAEKLPSRVSELLSAGDLDKALEKTRALHPAERAILITDIIRKHPDAALNFITALTADNEDNAAAVVAAIGAEKFEPALPLLPSLQKTAGRPLQKLIKKTLFDLRAEGLKMPAEQTEAKPQTPANKETDTSLPLHRAVLSKPLKSGLALAIIARTRPNRKLKVFSVLVSLWKRGIYQAGLRVNMSRSAFDRFVKSQASGRFDLHDATIEDCCQVIARGMRIAKEFGAPLPFDFGVGKSLLGNIDAIANSMETPFLCSQCNQPLETDIIEKIRASAPYDNIPVETRCANCQTVDTST